MCHPRQRHYLLLVVGIEAYLAIAAPLFGLQVNAAGSPSVLDSVVAALDHNAPRQSTPSRWSVLSFGWLWPALTRLFFC